MFFTKLITVMFTLCLLIVFFLFVYYVVCVFTTTISLVK